jgi:hypothetical protein
MIVLQADHPATRMAVCVLQSVGTFVSNDGSGNNASGSTA